MSRKSWAARAVGGDEPVHAVDLRDDRVKGLEPFAGRLVQQVGAVEMQKIEHEHRQRLRGPCRVDVGAAPEAGRGDLESVRATVGTQRDGLGVGDQVGDGQRQGGLDHLRQPFGDVVKAAGVDRHGVTRAVDLDACAVQLRLENRCAAETFECFGDARRGLREHGAHRPADCEGELFQCCLATGERRGGHRRQGPAEHGRTPHRSGGDACRLGHRIGHHPDQGTLAQLSAKKAAQKRLLLFGRRREQSRDELGPPRLRALPCDRPDLREAGVGVEHGRETHRLRGMAANAAPPSRPRSAAVAAHRTAMTRRRRPASGRPRRLRGPAGRRCGRSSRAVRMWRRRRWMRRRPQRAARPQPCTRLRHLPAGRAQPNSSHQSCSSTRPGGPYA